jgi:hypothetical protein
LRCHRHRHYDGNCNAGFFEDLMHSATTVTSLKRSLAKADPIARPFRHWCPRDMLDPDSAAALAALPIALPDGLNLEAGRREVNNSSRLFFDPPHQARVEAMATVARAMQSAEMVAAWETLCGIDLTGCFLRIEYCRDGDGFWLEPHTDIGAKRITVLTYLSTDPDGPDWGTDVYDGHGRFVQSVPGDFNAGLVFVPAADTWHGFRKKPIRGLRRTLMLNYVGPEWRSRTELCFPDRPVK